MEQTKTCISMEHNFNLKDMFPKDYPTYIQPYTLTNNLDQRCTRCNLTPGLVNGLVSGLNQLLSRARFDGVWIGHNDKEVVGSANPGGV